MGNELFVKNGDKKEDKGIHEHILNNADAEKVNVRATIARAMKKYGLTFDEAEALYGKK